MESQSQTHLGQSHLQGEIRWYHVARSKAGRRILERSIARWLERHGLLTGSGKPQYRAILQREGQGHYVHCHIEVVAEGQSWSGSRVGSGLQQALADCLAHMTLRQDLLKPPTPVLVAAY